MAIAIIITRLLAKRKKTASAGLAITAGWFVVLYACGLMFLPFFGDVHLVNLQHYFWRFALSGIAFAATNILMYKTLNYLDAAVGSILATVNTLFTVAGAALFLHEDLSKAQIVGSALLLTAIIYGTLATRHKPSKTVHKNLLIGGLFALASGLTLAVAAINQKSVLAHVSVGDYLAFGWGWEALAAVAAVLLIQPKSLKILLNRSVLGWTLILGVLRATSGLCFMLAQIRSNNVALVTVIANFRLIIIVILGYWLLKERQKITQKAVAASASIAALAIMFRG